MIGAHAFRTWSLTQPSVTLSSEEAEFYGLVKNLGLGLGHQSIMPDFKLKTPVRVWTDSRAAIGISTRFGLGKLQDLETDTPWVQEKVRTGAIEVRKVRGDVNAADLFTKHLPSGDKIHQLVKLFGCEYRAGRSEAAPLLQSQGSSGGKGGQPATGHIFRPSSFCRTARRITKSRTIRASCCTSTGRGIATGRFQSFMHGRAGRMMTTGVPS